MNRAEEHMKAQRERDEMAKSMLDEYVIDTIERSLRTRFERVKWVIRQHSAHMYYVKHGDIELHSINIDIDGNVTVAKMWSNFIKNHYHAPVINIRLRATTGIMTSLAMRGMKPTREALGLPVSDESEAVLEWVNFNPHNALVPRIRAAWAVLRGRHNDKDVFG